MNVHGQQPFAFSIGSQVAIASSGERGEVIGRAEYAHYGNNYLVRYIAADGHAVENWWGESALASSAVSAGGVNITPHADG